MEIIKELKPNRDDVYSWEEVNCFFRAWAIMFSSYHPVYFNNFIQIMFFYWTFNNYEVIDDRNQDFMLDCNARVFRDVFGVEIYKCSYSGEHEFHHGIQSALKSKQRVLVPGDSIGLYYHPGYGVKHSEHFFIITGFNANLGIYYILDNLQIDQSSSTLYDRFAIPYDILFKSNQSFFEHVQPTESPYIWRLDAVSDSHPDNTRDIFIRNVDAINVFLPNYKNKTLDELLKSTSIGDISKKIEHFMMKFHHKSTYFKIIRKTFLDLKMNLEVFDQLVVRYNGLQRKIVLCLVGSSPSTAFIDDFVELEKSILIQVETLISTYLNNVENKSVKIIIDGNPEMDYVITNEKKLPLEWSAGSLVVDHRNAVQSDIWINNDDGFKLLWTREQFLNAGGKIEISLGDLYDAAYHAGIIVEYENYVAMYGPVGKHGSMSLFIPQRLDSYNIKTIPRTGSSITIQGMLLGEQINFGYKHQDDELYTDFDCPLSSDFVKVGFFSRMWEKGNHKVHVDRIVFNNKNILGS